MRRLRVDQNEIAPNIFLNIHTQNTNASLLPPPPGALKSSLLLLFMLHPILIILYVCYVTVIIPIDIIYSLLASLYFIWRLEVELRVLPRVLVELGADALAVAVLARLGVYNNNDNNNNTSNNNKN